jgi:CysZ protein
MQSVLPQWLGFLQWILWPLFGLVFLFVVAFTFTLVANVLGAPFYAVLAERLIAGSGLEAAQPAGAVRSAARGVWVELRRMAAYLLKAIPFLLLFLVPGINLLAPFLWLAFSAWSLTQDYFAYPFDALGLSYEEQRRALRELGTERFVFGALIQLGLAIPLVNVLVSPAAVAGATYCLIARLKPTRG